MVDQGFGILDAGTRIQVWNSGFGMQHPRSCFLNPESRILDPGFWIQLNALFPGTLIKQIVNTYERKLVFQKYRLAFWQRF